MKYIYTSKHIFLLILTEFICHLSYSQTIIKGKVVDAASREPLPYAIVIDSLNTHKKTFTDERGNFILKIPTNHTNLFVSSLGYKALCLPVLYRNNITIELQREIVSLKDVVVLQSNEATRFNTLTKIDLDVNSVRNTQELLRLVPGLFIAQHAGGGKAEQIFLRGFDADHGTDVEISVDGLPVNMVSHAHGQGYADAHFIIPETINNIDFGTGPYYANHGNLNTAGYVAYSTYNCIPESRIQVEAGRFNTFRTLALLDLLKKKKEKQSAYIASDFYYTNGPTLNKQNFNRFNLFGKYNFLLNDRTRLTLTASMFKSKWDASGQVPERAVATGKIDRFGSIDPSEGGNTERYNANFLLAHTFTNGTVLVNQAYYSRNIFNLFSNFTFFANDAVNGDEINQGEQRDIFGYNTKINQNYLFHGFALKSAYGAGIRYDATFDSKLSAVNKRQFIRNVKLGNIRELNASGYMQQQLNLGKWLIDAGIRLDHLYFNYFNKLSAEQNPSQNKTIVSPKLNIQYTVNPTVQFYVKSGKGFHSNDTRVVTANSGNEILPAAFGSDIGFILKPVTNLLLNVTTWYLHLDQEFVYVGDDGNIEPSGKTSRKGIDLIARYQFSKNVFANVNLTVAKARAIGLPKGENYIPLAPFFTSTGGLLYKAATRLNGGITYRYIKSRPANEINSVVAKGYLVADVSLNYTTPKYECGIIIENLLNAKWNEAQFSTTSRLKDEPTPITELNFTPGTPFFARLKMAMFF
ncbi:MAG: TonB-dependent receptor [Ferruginibacter sp.]